ncbi:hypothetical protein BDV25DRAFT_165315 [Aspergillus avenaceus]|uniref:Uncharacterized protein n=1 Tax=Aspergillus avenaceus TaxID=36643 RepID=A0A5N6TFI1_ASPAV|nr:hypothetical protein BDV25DRAFT_165315 [Aspergillus avenaceus]
MNPFCLKRKFKAYILLQLPLATSVIKKKVIRLFISRLGTCSLVHGFATCMTTTPFFKA